MTITFHSEKKLKELLESHIKNKLMHSDWRDFR